MKVKELKKKQIEEQEEGLKNVFGQPITALDIKNAWKHVDTNRDNKISFDEFCSALQKMGLKWSRGEAKAAFVQMDEDKSNCMHLACLSN